MKPSLFIINTVKREESHEVIYEIAEKFFKINNCKIIISKNGKPFFEEEKAYFNISYCDNTMVCIFNDREIGVDIERIRKYDKLVEKKVMNVNEQIRINDNKTLFWEYWTIKESFAKYKGTGINGDFNNIYINEDDHIVSTPNCYAYYTIKKYHDYIISICSKEELKDINIYVFERGKDEEQY